MIGKRPPGNLTWGVIRHDERLTREAAEAEAREREAAEPAARRAAEGARKRATLLSPRFRPRGMSRTGGIA